MHSTQYKTCGVASEAAPITTAAEPCWALVTCIQWVYSLVNTGMALFVLPLEAERLNASNGSLWVGVYLAVCGLTQLICPIVGRLSDHHSSRYGRRRPFIVFGIVGAVLAFLVMRKASTMLWPGVYLVFLFLGEMCLNIAYAAHCALPADLQGMKPGSQNGFSGEDDDGTKGIISGYMALHSFLGPLSAMVVVVFTRELDVQVQYPIFMVSLIFALFVVCVSAREAPTDQSSDEACIGLQDLSDSFCIDMTKDRDFFWVCAGRAFYYGSIASSVFLYYYLRDLVIVGGDEAAVRSHVATLVIIAQLVGAACSIPCGRLSNRIGRKVLIYVANTLMSATLALYTIAPMFGGFAWPVVLLASIFYGVGAATYMSVDYALALDCLPAGKTTAEAFGLWGVAGFVGSTGGPMIGGFLLWLPSSKQSWPIVAGGKAFAPQYSHIGYAMTLLTLGPVFNVIGAYFVSRITGLKEDLSQEKLQQA